MLFSAILFSSLVAFPVQQIQSLFESYGEKVGLSVRDSNGKELVAIHSTKTFSPASIAKLVSSACVLETLGAQFQFETPISIRGEIKNGALHGDLVLKGSGDFSFVIEDLKVIVEKIFHVFGIREIKGKLLIDTSYLAVPELQLFDGFEGDAGRSFSAVMTALPINHNSFSVWVNAQEPNAEVFPFNSVDLKKSVKLSSKPGRLNGSQTTLDYRFDEKILRISGSVGKDDAPKAYYRAAPKPYEMLAKLFAYNFQILGGKWTGQYATVSGIASTTELFRHSSRSISRLMIDINKLSTNFGSEMSAIAAASKKYSKPIGEEDLKNFIRSCAGTFGLNASQTLLDNASGLSRLSKISPSSLTDLLFKIESKEYWPEYLASLSVLGRDGTTRRRLPNLAGRARLKTGSIKGVKSLAGYVANSNGEFSSFALILNCTNCSAEDWRKREDRLLSLLIN